MKTERPRARVNTGAVVSGLRDSRETPLMESVIWFSMSGGKDEMA